MFLLKKILGPLLFPVPFGSLLLLVGLGLLWFSRRQKAGKVLVSAGTLVLIGLSFGTFTRLFLRPLEHQYLPLNANSVISQEAPVKWVVVLGGGGSYNPQLPSESQLAPASLSRLIEGIRLHRQIPGSKLIVSEGSIFQSGPVADLMGNVARELGVSADAVILERQSQDTESQAMYIQPLVNGDRFILVTSASHMPRAVGLFRKRGMSPIAAPTDFRASSADALRPSVFFPSAAELRNAEIAMHEYLGIAWGKLRGKI